MFGLAAHKETQIHQATAAQKYRPTDSDTFFGNTQLLLGLQRLYPFLTVSLLLRPKAPTIKKAALYAPTLKIINDISPDILPPCFYAVCRSRSRSAATKTEARRPCKSGESEMVHDRF
ncbi:hypothetical protein [Fretibacterium sp. OH1220_COT-178]|uniref:hypothetical protein n=1 Tax=Fretibacterium sp. OH1220_COT-178 TaxID=2491047 RepID=UPI00131522D2|nr:hypothetical protein [Fretibacterium sp. OH1220_COT-178]